MVIRNSKSKDVEFELTTLVVIGTDSTGSCKSYYHTITTTTVHKTEGTLNSVSISMRVM